MSREKQFEKYRLRGPDYHYRQIDKKNPLRFNAFVYARYLLHARAVTAESSGKRIRILEVGCGDAVLLWMIARSNPSAMLYGIDPSKEALRVAKKKLPSGNFKEASAYDLPFKDDYFDIVVSSDVIEHVARPERMTKDMRRVLKRGGLAIVGTPVRYTEEPLDKNHVKEFYPGEFLSLMEQHFTGCMLQESHPLLYAELYKSLTGGIPIPRYIMNALAILGMNLFLKERMSPQQLFAYMTVTGRK